MKKVKVWYFTFIMLFAICLINSCSFESGETPSPNSEENLTHSYVDGNGYLVRVYDVELEGIEEASPCRSKWRKTSKKIDLRTNQIISQTCYEYTADCGTGENPSALISVDC